MLRVFTDSRCLGHRVPPSYPEQPERLAGVLARLAHDGLAIEDLHPPAPTPHPAPAAGRPRTPPAGSPLASLSTPPPDALAAVTALHLPGYVDRFGRAVMRGDGLLDSSDNPLSPGVWDAAWGAVETALAAADWVAGGRDRVGFAAVRPPGHHAEESTAMGFCFFNSVAVAAEHLRRRHGASRVAIFDFDVHHGNGTQHLFEARSDVFFASTHQYPFYPGTGAADETGVGEGAGATLNLPLPAGTGDAGYAGAIQEHVLPALREYSPEILLISAGFDSWMRDPLAGMKVSEDGFAAWGGWLRRLAAEVCEGRIVVVLEGGYDIASLPRLVSAHLQALTS